MGEEGRMEAMEWVKLAEMAYAELYPPFWEPLHPFLSWTYSLSWCRSKEQHYKVGVLRRGKFTFLYDIAPFHFWMR